MLNIHPTRKPKSEHSVGFGMPICLQVDNGNAFTSEEVLHKLVRDVKDQYKPRFSDCDMGASCNDT